MATLSIDVNEMTLGDLEDFEELTGERWEDAMRGGKPRAKALTALTFIAMRRDNPDITIDEVRAVKLVALNESVAAAADEDVVIAENGTPNARRRRTK